MSGIEYFGDDVSRPVQDNYKMKKRLRQQDETIKALQAKLDHYERAVKDASKTILELEEKIRVAEDKLLKKAAK